MLELVTKAIDALNNVGNGLNAVAEAINNQRAGGTTKESEDSLMLLALQEAGVDNWGGYSHAMQVFEGYKKEEPTSNILTSESVVPAPEFDCVACSDTGKNSKGKPCPICKKAEEPAAEEPAAAPEGEQTESAKEAEETPEVTLQDLKDFAQEHIQGQPTLMGKAKKLLLLRLKDGEDKPKLDNVDPAQYAETLTDLKKLAGVN